jgi:hypothetical protein
MTMTDKETRKENSQGIGIGSVLFAILMMISGLWGLMVLIQGNM